MLSLSTPDIYIYHTSDGLEAKAAIYNQPFGLKGVADLLITSLSTGCQFSVLLM